MIDWQVAQAAADRLVRPGPQVDAAEAAEAVAELREGAQRSEQPVRDFTGLHARSATAPIVVVDRKRWVEANLSSFRVLLDPLLTKLEKAAKTPGPVARSVGRKVNGAEVGSLMAFMSTKVLGQFDPFSPAAGGTAGVPGPAAGGTAGVPGPAAGGTAGVPGPAAKSTAGRLLLVAPNIVQAERQLGVDPHDFRLWVCLHEETHRVQFTAVPWMADHLASLMAELVEATDVDASAIAKLLGDGVQEIVKVVRGESEASLAEIFQNEQQRAVVDKMTGIMSLLEGHADVVMDGVGPEVIPTVDEIRRRFDQRRQGAGGLDRVLRRLLGLEGKMRQYRDGAAFVRAVNDQVGLSGFNAVWESPANLPDSAEIRDPSRWVARVHG